MSEVVSLGSINVDRVQYLTAAEIRSLESRFDWYPENEQTVKVETVPETLVDREYENYLGGKGANQAVAAATAGVTARLLGSVGRDEHRYDVLSILADRGVSIDAIAVGADETGKAYIWVDESGDSRIAIVGGANDATDERYVDRQFETISGADVLLLQNEIPVSAMEAVLDGLEGDTDPTVVLNPTPTEGARPLLGYDAVDVVVVNEIEYATLADELAGFGGTVVRTEGADDVVVTGDVEYRVTPPDVDPVDATGAGDVFCGFLAARLSEGEPIHEAVETATIAASLSTEAEGAQKAIAQLEDIHARVRQLKA